ncbi:MAG TPA: SDR family NAD(P)-dependent oxidoreductase [Dehalococcoidia bacterium]|jgi:3-oxoacyl-[acyl-carrier protein] reductase
MTEAAPLTHQGRVAVVTGAARGIGQTLALRLAERGAAVFGVDLTDLTETESLVRRTERDWLGIRADVSSEEDAGRIAGAVDAAFGRCDILINNAGIYPFRDWEEMDFATWRRIISVNLDSQYLMCRALVPLMKRNAWGRIVNISSGSLLNNGTRLTAYKASKAGVIGFTRGLASEVGDYGITVNAVGPALTRTPGVIEGGNEGRLQSSAERLIVKRVPVPDDVAGTVLFLTSEDSGFVTGQTIMANGGGGFL